MTQFDQYRWEDRVLRKGSWKVNLAVGALAFAVLAGACLDSRARPQSDGRSVVELELPQQEVPAAMRSAMTDGPSAPFGS